MTSDGIKGIYSIILGVKDSINIVEIANESLLGIYIPKQLRSYGSSDFNYDQDVLSFLVSIDRTEDSSSKEIFFDKLYNSIGNNLCCRRFDKCTIKEENLSCEAGCSKFLDNGIRNKLSKYIKSLGYSIDDGHVISDFGESVEIEQVVNEIIRETSVDIVGEFLPEDIKTKAIDMSSAYVLLYCIENSLRIFVEKICYNQYGDGFIQKIKMSTDLERKIKNRKAEEETNKWLSVRGGNDLFYLDLDDLGKIIQNNWDLFKGFFPSQNWIVVKIEEIAKCRNLIAHNSYIKTDDRKLLPLYYKHILKHIQEQYKAEKKPGWEVCSEF